MPTETALGSRSAFALLRKLTAPFYFFSASSLASATRAWWPASETAFKNASTLSGVGPFLQVCRLIWRCAYEQLLDYVTLRKFFLKLSSPPSSWHSTITEDLDT